MSRPDLALVQGRARFTGDLPLPVGCLHAQPAVAPVPHARFAAVHAAAALAEPGVVAVLTAADIPGDNEIGNLVADEPLLAADEVRCVGQPYALVVAESADAAWRASRLVSADWATLPAVVDLRAAIAAGSLLQPVRTLFHGDVDAAWSECATVVSGRVDLGSADHVYLETQCALAIPLDVGLRVHSATQSPSTVQAAVARVTGLPMRAVEVDVSRLGGGFGGKEEQATGWACLAALAAVRLGRPVRLWLDRHDDLTITGGRHPCRAEFRLGLDSAQRILAYEATLSLDAGHSTDLSPAVLERALLHATDAYAIPHVRISGGCYRTNLPSNTAFRGFGAPQGIFVIEAAIRAAARQLGVPPEQLQQHNLLRDGDELPYGQAVGPVRGREAWSSLSEQNARVRAADEAWNGAGPRIRRGSAMVPLCFGIGFVTTAVNQAEALLHVYSDGSVSVSTGAVEMGQGVHAKVRAVVAATLGVPPELVSVASANTLRVANVSPTAASTGADLNGGAAREACRTILARLRPTAAELLGCAPTEVEFTDGAAGPSGRVAWPDLVRAAYDRRVGLSAQAHYATPGLHLDTGSIRGTPFRYHVFGAALVEAEVDTLLGTGRVTRATVVHDCGHSLDEPVDRGQIEGALVQGVGWMTTEEVRRDAAGRLLSDSLASYKIPDLADAPEIEVRLLRRGNAKGLLNSKAVGEPPLVYGLGAYFALQDAIAGFAPDAATVFTSPLTPERIFGLLHGVRT